MYSLCGMIAPVLYVIMTILGGLLRPGYSHLSDTVSELFSPGAPNKQWLDVLHVIFAFLLVLFGIGILSLVRESQQYPVIGMAGASLFIMMGAVSVTTATVFPQDAWGSTATFAGRMHIALSGVISVLSILSFVLIAIWTTRAGLFPGFGTFSFIIVGFVVLSGGFFVASVGGPIMGLAERITIGLGFAWVFVLAWWMNRAETGSR